MLCTSKTIKNEAVSHHDRRAHLSEILISTTYVDVTLNKNLPPTTTTTMKYTLTAASLLALAAAEVHEVTVGPGLSYSPDTVTAAQGDVVQFKFGSGHDVVSGSFDSPCENNGKIYSGMPSDGDVFSVTIDNTDPIWM
jgi:plastocyanin